MKYILLILLMTASYTYAGYPEKILYWYDQNVSTNLPALSEIVTLRNDSDGAGTKLTWKIVNPPTKATIDAINNTTATNWYNALMLEKAVDYSKWTDRERRLFKWTVKEINKLRVHVGGTAYTKKQVMQDLKGE